MADHLLLAAAVRFDRSVDLTKADPVDRTEAGCVGVAEADEAEAGTSRHCLVARLRHTETLCILLVYVYAMILKRSFASYGLNLL